MACPFFLHPQPIAFIVDNPFGDLKSYAPEDNRLMSSGSLIAVSYEARARGVKRSMRGAEAKKVREDMTLILYH
jgi:DNA polymerase eta